jgi:type I restriction enzyme R subunit
MVSEANVAAEGLDLDESDTRRIIDAQLRNAGWEADTDNLNYKADVRPQQGKNLAIAEWPTSSGPADYVLFIGLKCSGCLQLHVLIRPDHRRFGLAEPPYIPNCAYHAVTSLSGDWTGLPQGD